jgi:hypothetical protein
MPYVTLNLSDKIEMNGFEIEAEARAYCRKGPYPIFVLFEGTIDDALEDKLTTPIAVYVRGKGFNTSPVEKDVPYTTYRVIMEKLPSASDFQAIVEGPDDTYADMGNRIKEAFAAGKRLVWLIYEDSRLIDVYNEPNRMKMFNERDTIDGGDVIPGFSILVRDLFEEVVVE